jgi:hypothetical protein
MGTQWLTRMVPRLERWDQWLTTWTPRLIVSVFVGGLTLKFLLYLWWIVLEPWLFQ